MRRVGMPGLSHPIILGIVLATLQSKTVNITNVTYLSSVFCALYTRGNEQGEAVTHKCPNYQHGIIALSIALALAGATMPITSLQIAGCNDGLIVAFPIQR